MDIDRRTVTHRQADRRRPAATGSSRSPGGERGFALALVLIALVGLTALGVGGWLLSSSGFKASQAQRTSSHAFYLANAGLEQFLATHQGPVPSSSVTFTYADGTAEVTVQTMNDLTQTGNHNPLQSVWKVRSVGRHQLPKGGTAVRTVQTLALLNADSFNFPSAFSSASGMRKNGAAGVIDGHDASMTGECPEAGARNTNGVMTPESAPYEQTGGAQLVPEGEPKDTALTASAQDLLEATGVDWPALIAGETLQFDYRIPPDPWPDYSAIPSDEWPVIYVDNEGEEFTVGPGKSGRGTLIVRGDLKMDGSFEWKGPILVGGALTTDGFQTVEGGITSGFNLLLGEAVDQSSIGNGSKSIEFHYCNNNAAMKHTATFVQLPGTWFESF